MRGEKRLAEWWPRVACRVTGAIGLVMALSSSALAQVGADFNGDGFDDLAIGVPHEDMFGSSDSGAVHVLYGSAAGLQATGVGGPDDQVWYLGFSNDEECGAALATGDFNHDGFDDLAIGVPGKDVLGIAEAGAVRVLYGSTAGLQNTGAGGPDDQLWDQAAAGVGSDPETSDRFGSALAAGDFNNDSFDDLAIGVPFEDVGTISNAGALNVLYGSGAGLQATGVGGPVSQVWHQGMAGVGSGLEESDAFGWVLTAHDFNNDGFDDLAIGVPTEGVGTISAAGAVNVLYGSVAGLQATGVGGPDSEIWHQGVLQETPEELDHFGGALAAGDFNHDGFGDLAIGALSEDLGTSLSAGVVHVLYGWAQGLAASGVGTSPDPQLWHQNVAGVDGIADFLDAFGAALAAGDFNNDGNDDLAIGVPQEGLDVGVGVGQPGAVTLLYGSTSGLQTGGLGGPSDELWHQNVLGVDDTAEERDFFGGALATGDFNNDTFDDLAISAHGETLGSVFFAGAVNVLHGSIDGLQALGFAGPADQFWHQDVAGVQDMTEGADAFGLTLGGEGGAWQ